MSKRNTKEIILLESLRLFSERGYEGVGLRDIAQAVGIRESGIYKHYDSKQNIYDSILLETENRYENFVKHYDLPDSISEALTGVDSMDHLIVMCARMFHFYLIDEYGSQTRRLLTIEQFRQTKAGEMFRDEIIDRGLSIVTDVFTVLMNNGYFIETDPFIMAVQFYSPLYFLLSKYDGMADNYQTAVDSLAKHVIQFNALYFKGGDL